MMAGLLIWAAVQCGVGLAVVLAWLLFRSGGFKRRPDVQPSGPGWELTDERFVDPTSGEVLVVWYCPRTGERVYVQGR